MEFFWRKPTILKTSVKTLEATTPGAFTSIPAVIRTPKHLLNKVALGRVATEKVQVPPNWEKEKETDLQITVLFTWNCIYMLLWDKLNVS